MVPAYTDISHFRAPYKNAMISGFGVEEPGPPGAPPGGSPPLEPTGPPDAAFVEVSSEGYRTLKKSVQALLRQNLTVYTAVHMGGEFNNAQLVPFNDEQRAAQAANPAAMAPYSANAWIDNQVKSGEVVFLGMAALVPLLYGGAIPPGADQMGTFPAGSDQAKASAKTPVGVVIGGKPGGATFLAGLGPIGIVLLVGGGLVVGSMVYKGMKKKGGGRSTSMQMPAAL